MTRKFEQNIINSQIRKMVCFRPLKPSSPSTNYLPYLVVLIAINMCLVGAQGTTLFKVYPLAEDYFENIYLVNHQSKQYYLIISCKESNILSISITETRDFQEAPRFNIYGSNQNRPRMGQDIYTFLRQCHAYVDVSSNSFFEVKRTKDSQSIFTLSDVTFRPLHNSFTVTDSSTKWGLGQRFQSNFRVVDGKWTLWNRDKPWKIDRGMQGLSDQSYGHQPVYLAREKKSKLYHLTYFKNTFGLLVQANKDADELIYHSVGGNIHFLIVLGQDDPQAVLEKYHDYIGRSHIPPFWSMGYHQCRWGYRSTNVLLQVLQKFAANDLPIDTIWSDLEYMDQKRIFTVNPLTHGGNTLNKMMKDHQVHFVPLLDVGVSIHDQEAMKLGKELDVFLHSPRQIKEYYTGEVWPGQVHFVDYHHPKASQFWKQQMLRLYKQVQFSGIWLDMNEPSNFRGNQPTQEPYRIQQNQGINQMTINVDIPHYTTSKIPLKHREAHAYYGHMSTVPTHQFLKEQGKRPFIISRSNSVGSGHLAGHWTGDNVANWQFLRSSINANFLFQIFGIQMVGADICGFYLDTTEQLCSRWMQLGAFYPFSRNHNYLDSRSQQPYAMGKILLETSRLSLKTRYALLKQFYTIMVQKQGKGSFFRPIGFQFYDDEGSFSEEFLETQFLIGRGIMIAPIVVERATDREVYFPSAAEEWYSFKIDTKLGNVISNQITKFSGKTKSRILNTLPSAPPIFLRSGFAVLTNSPTNRVAKLTNNFHLFAALKNGEASTQILGIQDYGNEAHLSQCIEKGCTVFISLKKEDNDYFTVAWNYDGPKQMKGVITISSVLVIMSDIKWSYNTSIQLPNSVGSFRFQAKKI